MKAGGILVLCGLAILGVGLWLPPTQQSRAFFLSGLLIFLAICSSWLSRLPRRFRQWGRDFSGRVIVWLFLLGIFYAVITPLRIIGSLSERKKIDCSIDARAQTYRVSSSEFTPRFDLADANTESPNIRKLCSFFWRERNNRHLLLPLVALSLLTLRKGARRPATQETPDIYPMF